MIGALRRLTGRGRRDPSPELAAEIASEPGWMYRWDLGLSEPPPMLDRDAPDPELEEIHETRLELLEGPVRDALREGGDRATAVDLACSEGWFAHRLLDWGASRVLGIDVRAQSVRRAELVRDHLGVPTERLEFRRADVLALDPKELGTFDVVLCLGLIYHLEDPVGALRVARMLTGRVCIVESQLIRHEGQIAFTDGRTNDTPKETAAAFAAWVEDDASRNPIASDVGVVSLVPNRAALELAVRAAGFSRLEWLPAGEQHNPQYRNGDRGALAAWP